MEVSQIRKGVLLLIYCLVSEIHNVPPGGDSLKQAHYEFRETSRAGHRAGNRGWGAHEAKTGKREQERQVKKDEVSINRKQPYGLFTS